MLGNKSHVSTINVVQANVKHLPGGECEFFHIGQTFLDVTESTANVNYIVQRWWGSDYVLVMADGLEIEDISGTQGMPMFVCACILLVCSML